MTLKLSTPLDRLFRLTGTDVLIHGVPLLGLPGSINLEHNGVARALPEGDMVRLLLDFDSKARGGLASITVLRSPYWRRVERMAVIGHDAARIKSATICTVPWMEDSACEVWLSQAAAAGTLLVSAWRWG